MLDFQAVLAKDAFETLCKEVEIVVADEGHQIKNPATRKFAAVSSLSTKRRIALTGYPLQNNLDEYYTMIRWCLPDALGDPSYFHSTFANPNHDGEGDWPAGLKVDNMQTPHCLACLLAQ